jgi:hypothetical protein
VNAVFRDPRALAMPPAADAPARAGTDHAQGDTPRLYRNYLRFTPLLWVGGVLYIASVFMLLALAWKKQPRGGVVRLVIAAWLSIALAQAVCAVLNGVLIGDPGLGLRNVLSFGVVGWAFGALAIAVGAAWQLGRADAAQWVSNNLCCRLLSAHCCRTALRCASTHRRCSSCRRAPWANRPRG